MARLPGTGQTYTATTTSGSSSKPKSARSSGVGAGYIGASDARRTNAPAGSNDLTTVAGQTSLLQANTGQAKELLALQNQYATQQQANMVQQAKELSAIASQQRITETKESIAAQTAGALQQGQQQGEYRLKDTNLQGEWNLRNTQTQGEYQIKGIGLQAASQEKIAQGQYDTQRYQTEQERASRLETTQANVQGQRDVAGINAQAGRDVANINVQGQLSNTRLTGGFNMAMQQAGFRQENKVRREDMEYEQRIKRLQAAEAAKMNRKIGLV